MMTASSRSRRFETRDIPQIRETRARSQALGGSKVTPRETGVKEAGTSHRQDSTTYITAKVRARQNRLPAEA